MYVQFLSQHWKFPELRQFPRKIDGKEVLWACAVTNFLYNVASCLYMPKMKLKPSFEAVENRKHLWSYKIYQLAGK